MINDRILQIQAEMPEEIRVGEQFTYRVTVTNTSDSMTIHDVKLKQADAEGFTIESASLEGEEQQQQQAAQSNNQTGASSQDQSSDPIGAEQAVIAAAGRYIDDRHAESR